MDVQERPDVHMAIDKFEKTYRPVKKVVWEVHQRLKAGPLTTFELTL